MKIVDHGEWEIYVPAEPPPHLPSKILYARRKSDMMDWYQYIYPPKDAAKNFGANTIKGSAMWKEEYNAYVVGPATTDVTRLFPPKQFVFEIIDYTGTEAEAFKEFNGKVYDPAAKVFSNPAPVNPTASFPAMVVTKLEEISERLTKLEKKKK